MSLIPQGTGIPGPAGPAGPQGISGLTATLSQVLTNGNTSGPNDIVMLDGLNKKSIRNANELEADTINTDTIKPGIGALSQVVRVDANLLLKDGVTAGEGVMGFELCNGTILTQGTNTLNVISDTLTAKTASGNQSLSLSASAKTANLTSVNGTITTQHYSQPNTNTNTQVGMRYTDPPAGHFRKVEVGADINGPYTRLESLTQDNTFDNVLNYNPSNGNVFYRQIPVETNKYIIGDFTIQTVIPDAVFDNETYNVANLGIDKSPGVVINIPLTVVGNNAFIPFFTRDGTNFPTNTISDNGTPIDPFLPPVPTSVGNVRCIATDPYNPKVYVCCYEAGGPGSGTMVYEFNIEQNLWNQYALVDGEVNCIIINGNYMYLGGTFSTTITQSGTTTCRNIIEIEMGTITANALPEDGLNSTVNCFELWNGYLAIGGKFDQTFTPPGANLFQKFALYDRNATPSPQFLNINQSTSSVVNQWGFNDDVYSLAVLPQTNTLLIGGIFTTQYANGNTYTYQKLCQYGVKQPFFNNVGDGSLSGAVVSDLLVDYEGGMVYVAGDFSTSVGNRFVAMPINTISKYINLGWSGSAFQGGYTNTLTKDEIGGYIWIMNVSDGTLFRFNPNVNIANAYENTLMVVSMPVRAVYYSWYDEAVHYGIDSGDVYYRYYCEQRMKIKNQNNGDLFVLGDGSEYNVLVLPKTGSTVSVRGGLQIPNRWYVFGASPGVYGEWATGQITEPGPAYATCRMTDTIPIGGVMGIGWNEIVGKNINLSTLQSDKIVVKQKGLYKMNYRVNVSGNSGVKVYVWFVVNGNNYQQTNTRSTIANNGDYQSYFGEVLVQLNIDDFVGLKMDGTTTADVVSIPANIDQPGVPGVIFNIELVNPTREPFF